VVAGGTALRTRLEFSADLGRHSLDVHLLSCVVALAAAEVDGPFGLCHALGLGPRALMSLLQDFFGSIDPELGDMLGEETEASEEELRLRRLLTRSGRTRSRFEGMVALILARRCLRPHHLWQDLGLDSREELGLVMRRHFPSLVRRNAGGMRWKKFLYRMVCADDDHAWCSAPTCEECEEREGCFGGEGGASLLAGSLHGCDKS
jgi:nitrogen fixation protein NifQ